MTQLSLFNDDRPAQAQRLAPKLKKLAEQRVYFGTSSWKYEGWLGSIYTPSRYETRGKLSKAKFDKECLEEYAETFPVVCGDFAFYQFPTPDYWAKLFKETPESLAFGFKVPEDVTVAKWPKHARYGTRAGLENDSFLDPGLFRKLFAKRLEPYAERVATLMFEFGTFAKATFPRVDDFLARLDPFLGALPEGFRYAVEIRNPEYLGAAYFETLARHNVAHVLNAWTRMPEIGRQIENPGVWDVDFSVARALLPYGRAYEKAVADLAPYERVKEPSEPTRNALAAVAERSITRKKPAFLFVNNRLEGHAPTTIEAVADRLLP
jgi:uncharacterized protein YecE (DUF72 family)